MLKYRTLLRGVMDYKGDKKELEYILENYNNLRSSGIVFDLDIHAKIFDFVCGHASKFVEVPSFDRVKKKFEEDSDVLEELSKITQEPVLYASNYKSVLGEVFEEQKKKELVELLKETSVIADSGKKVDRNTFIRGVKDAVQNFLHKSNSLIQIVSNVRLFGSLRGDSSEAISEYYDVKNNKKFDGLLSGLPSIDLVCKGIRPPELWLIVAFVSELKTTLSMNLAYTQAVEQGKNVKFLTLEMPYKQVRDLFICLHSANLNLWPGSEWDDVYPLNYDAITDGTLTEREEEFFKFLCEDLDNNPEYGFLDIYQPPEGLTISHLKAWAEMEFRKEPFDILYLDYIELMKSESNGKDYTVELNQRIKDLKQFAIHFNNGKGLRVISAYQANRKGKENADKCDGEYRLDALSYANEAERSADVIIYSYLNDELRENNQAKIGCLKNRSRPKFKQFKAKTNLACRKIYESTTEKDLENERKFNKNKNSKIMADSLINDII